MKNKINKTHITVFVLVLFLFLIVIVLPGTLANNTTHEISTFDELIAAANRSKLEGYNDDNYVLKNDIVITEENQEQLLNSETKYISFGSSDVPFIGTFDGNGFTISNLKYDSTLTVISDTGLFSVTGEGAVIKNVVIDNANLQADYRGGIVAGYSEGTVFENIIVKNSNLFVSASNNVVSLITDGGIRGGAIVGEVKNSILYNCESENNVINTNNTAGVAALSGKGLTLGALVGISDSSLIEYSRVYSGIVNNHYDVAVGALGGNTLYVGGIVGRMQGTSRVIDSFSTAHLEFYCATYVSIGSGNSGHIGGITAAMEGSSNEIVRSHYAGTTKSTQYNAILVIPVIQNNVNISGLVNSYGGGSVVNSYFKPSLNPDVDMNVLGNKTTTNSYGPLEDDKYSNKNFWASQFYDISGTIKRSSEYSETHFNKWVIDSEKGIPIHGKSVSATLDFKDAGVVTIDKTELINSTVSTSNPYEFAVQGISAEDIKINLSATENAGYRFIGWYKEANVATWSIEENYDYFQKIFDNNEVISVEKDYQGAIFDSNDLFIARYQANLLFHDINGNIINVNDGLVLDDASHDSNWYYYGEVIPDVSPINKPTNENAKLIGWTTEKSNETGGGYSGITSTQLSTLKANGTFYEIGDIIEKTLNLYPVYVDLISNITTIFEGNELDSNSIPSLREGVGSTDIYKDENDNVVLKVVGANADGSLPYGYRFIGWYSNDGVKLSDSITYVLEDIDLTKPQTFIARFEYLVEYYVKAFDQGNNALEDSFLYDSRYQKYNTDFEAIVGPSFIREEVSHWGTAHASHNGEDNSDVYSSKITGYTKVYSHNIFTGTPGNYAVLMDTDFPNSGTITNANTSGTYAEFLFTPKSDRYNFMFWTFERSNSRWTYSNPSMRRGPLNIASVSVYKGRAMVTADIHFYMKDGSITEVIRRYGNSILMSEDQTYTYMYPHYATSTIVDTSTEDDGTISSTITLGKSPDNDSMHVEGYAFLGWISSSDVKKNSEEWNRIYDVANDLYCTSNVDNAIPYLINETDLVSEAHDLYPVYSKYNITNKTNILVENESHINMPSEPEYIIEEDGLGSATITIIPDLDTYVTGSDGRKYKLESVVRLYDDESEEIIPDSGNNTYKYEIIAGNHYTFVVNYEPYIITYHLNNEDVFVDVKDFGELIGTIPEPTYNMENFSKRHLFIGYTSKKTELGYHIYDYNEYINQDIPIISQSTAVSKSLELFPVYVATDLTINSNIDSYLEDNSIELTTVRDFVRQDNNKMNLLVHKAEISDYRFIGWYKNYKNSTDLGDLVTPSLELNLSEFDSLDNTTYTAVYKEIYTVNYFGKDGGLLYTIDVPKESNRTFVDNVTDEEGSESISPIDYDAFVSISNTLSKDESFNTWQAVYSGKIVHWDDFYYQVITSDMDLYPIINKVTIKDFNDTVIDINDSNNSILDVEFQSDKLMISLNDLYEEDKMTVHLEQIAYTNNLPIITNINNFNIIVEDKMQEENKIIGEGLTNQNGDVVFSFEKAFSIELLEPFLNLRKDVFLYKIVELDNLENSILNFTIEHGETKTFKLPYGKYKIVEDSKWSWKYEKSYTLDIQINNKLSENIEINRNIISNKWFNKTLITK